MSRPRVLVDPGPYATEEDWRRLEEVAEVVRVTEERDEAGLIDDLDGCAGLIAQGGRLPPLTEAVFRASAGLRIVGVRGDRFGTGVDLPAAHEQGVRVIDTDNISSAPPVAEWDLAMVLICLRNAGAVYRQMMAGTETWAVAGNEGFVHGELTGKRVGLVGCGHVGQRLIELLAPFRVDLLVSDPYLEEEVAGRLRIRRGRLDEVLDHAEILVVQVPHTPKTEGLIGAAELERLGDGRILVNCSRGKVIDQQALIARLQDGAAHRRPGRLRPRAPARRQRPAPPAQRVLHPAYRLVRAPRLLPLLRQSRGRVRPLLHRGRAALRVDPADGGHPERPAVAPRSTRRRGGHSPTSGNTFPVMKGRGLSASLPWPLRPSASWRPFSPLWISPMRGRGR